VGPKEACVKDPPQGETLGNRRSLKLQGLTRGPMNPKGKRGNGNKKYGPTHIKRLKVMVPEDLGKR